MSLYEFVKTSRVVAVVVVVVGGVVVAIIYFPDTSC
jgi:hypothetical protein